MDSFSKPASFLYSVSFFLFFLHSLRHLHKILAYSWTKLQTKRTKPLIFIIQLSLSKFASEIHHLSALQTSSGSHTEPHSSMLFINQKCFNTYKNNKTSPTRTHTHYQDAGVLYMMNPTETEDMWSLLWRLGCSTLSLSAPVIHPGWGVYLWCCAQIGRGNSLHSKQAAH